MANGVKANTDGLDNLLSLLEKDYILRVGILGSKAKAKQHKNSSLTNAEIGTFHEFGSEDGKHPPRRSFLVDSLQFKLKFNEEQMKPIRQSFFKNFFDKKAPIKFLEDLGANCLLAIEEGFATNGFGMWKPLAASTMAAFQRKHGIQGVTPESHLSKLRKYVRLMSGRNILTDTGKLRKSIGFKVIRRK